MRILIYSYNYHPEPIGIAPLMTELAEGLAARGHEVRVVTGMPNYPERCIYEGYRGKWYVTESQNGVIIQRSYVWIRPQPGLLTRMLFDGSFVITSLVQAFKGWRPDVILSTTPPLPICIPVALLSRLYGCPTVLNVQDILPEAAIHVGLVKNKVAIGIFKALEKFAYRTADCICVITEEFQENLASKGVPPAKITCIPNWVDVDFVRPLPKVTNAFRQCHNLQDKFVVMYSGNIALTQGLTTVIQAADRLRHIAEITFVVVGETAALANLRQLCDEYHLSNVLLLPFQPRTDLPQMLAAADVGLIVQKLNVVSFNMPSKMQVWLASSRPIVASAPLNGTAARAVHRSGGGIVVPPEQPGLLADAILSLYHDPDRADALGKQGRQHAIEHYAYEQILNQYEALFAQLASRFVRPQQTAIHSSGLDVEGSIANIKR